MENFIILKMIEPAHIPYLEPITEVSDIAYCNESDELLLFDSFQSAANYRDENCLDGRIVELPLY
jgi:hypothetical protein